MTTRKKTWIAIAVIILVILLIIFLLPGRKDVVKEAEPELPRQVEEPTVVETTPTINAEEEKEIRIETASLQSLSKTFTERYGSYSTESNFANLRDVMPLMTSGFKAKTQGFIDSSALNDSYYGVTTRVISVTVEEENKQAGTAKVLVSTQREEAVDSPQNISVRYQDLQIEYIFESGTWKVSSATWL